MTVWNDQAEWQRPKTLPWGTTARFPSFWWERSSNG